MRRARLALNFRPQTVAKRRRWTLLLGGFLAAGLLATLFPTAGRAQDKVALVIGNGRYAAIQALPNPGNDAQAITQSLRKLGFDVVPGIDLDRAGMERAVREFLHKAASARMALLFYAGHGMQVDGKNYLLPVDVKFLDTAKFSLETVEVDKILDGLSDVTPTVIIILDACRDNPLAVDSLAPTQSGPARPTSGLAAYSMLGSGALIAYATAPGRVALDGKTPNSPFSEALLKYIATPGLEVRQMMTRVRAEVLKATENKQIPWDNSSLLGDVFLSGGPMMVSPPSRGVTGAPAVMGEDCVSLNPETTRAMQVRGSWKLVDGNHWILDFGNRQQDAEKAEAIVKYYKLNRTCYARRPKPSFIYWLVGDESAVGSMPGEDCVAFNPDNVSASFVAGAWKVVDGNHWMFQLPNERDAQRAVQVIKQYGFKRSCFVGRPGPTMSYLRK